MNTRSVTAYALASCVASALGTVPLVVVIGGRRDLSSAILSVVVILYALSAVFGIAAWILGLVKTARIGRWGWFATVFFLGLLGALVYGFVGPSGRSQLRAP